MLVKPRAAKRTVGNFGVERSLSEIPDKLTLRLSVSVCLKKKKKKKKLKGKYNAFGLLTLI